MSEQFDIREFDPSRSLSVEASAGTGKTYTIQLMVARMIASGTPLEKILLVTYTEKAAGELKDRLRRKIDDVLGSGRVADGIEIGAIVPPGVDWKANFEAARQSVDNAQVFTIHSFCQKVLREHAYEAGLPFETGNVAEEAVGELIDELIRDEWSEDGEFVALLDGSDGASSLARSLKGAFAGIIDKYRGKARNGEEIVSLGDVESPKLGDDRLSVEDLEKIAKATDFEELVSALQLEERIGVFEKNKNLCFTKKGNGTIPEFLDNLKSWEKGTPLYAGSFKDGKCPQEDWPKDMYAAFSYLKELKALLGDIDKKAYDLKLQRFLVSRAGDVFDAWQRRKAEEKLQTFNDMILSVHRAFMEDGNSLKERIRDRYQYAVIDEFQDTNQLQWDIFKTLFFDVKDHAVFVVGDPKQSIYGFQGADLRVYQRAVGEMKNARRLSCNYRSTEEMVNALKALFGNGYFVADEAESDEIHASGKVIPPEIGGEPAKPVWTMESEGGPEDFAKAAVAKIVEWCSGGKNRLRIFDKDAKQLRDATFGDFAVLARTGTEMPEIEDALRKAGVPYARYKEKRLFASRECAEWIALFRAVASPDFAAENHKVLNEALVTDFFGRRLVDVETDLFDDPMCAERRKVEAWHALARRGRWAEMLERILADTGVEGRLSDIGKMQGLSRLRQIGGYSVDYLYGNRCSLDALIRHLEGLARGDDEADDENGDLVEKGTDFDAVQVMTIHASKGLQFPVVIAFGGFVGHNNSAEGPYLYHDGNRALLGFGKGAKENQKKEAEEEWRRLFYVCYTRAESLLLLPKYDKGRKTSPYGIFLAKAIEAVGNDCGKLQKFEGDASELKKAVQAILASPKTDCTNDDSGATETGETDNRGRLQRELGGKRVYQHSYSTLSKRVGAKPDEAGRLETPSVEPEGGERPDRDDAAGVLGASSKTIDPENVSKAGEDATTDDERRRFNRARYPKGARVGNALHKLFETTAFREFGLTYPDPDKAAKSAESGDLGVRIDEQFELESLDVRSHGAEWNPLTAGILWNTLHARLPVIAGGSFRDGEFSLAELPPEAHRPEVRFDLLAARTENAELQGVCKGFIDLLFVREVDGVKRYSILDWKSDGLEDYAPATVRKQVDDHYCVQRVLYSYCLIQWLKQFYGNDEAEVFENRFGGVYYVFLRGTRGGTDSGVYAQTWKDYASLEKAFENVKGLM